MEALRKETHEIKLAVAELVAMERRKLQRLTWAIGAAVVALSVIGFVFITIATDARDFANRARRSAADNNRILTNISSGFRDLTCYASQISGEPPPPGITCEPLPAAPAGR